MNSSVKNALRRLGGRPSRDAIIDQVLIAPRSSLEQLAVLVSCLRGGDSPRQELRAANALAKLVQARPAAVAEALLDDPGLLAALTAAVNSSAQRSLLLSPAVATTLLLLVSSLAGQPMQQELLEALAHPRNLQQLLQALQQQHSCQMAMRLLDKLLHDQSAGGSRLVLRQLGGLLAALSGSGKEVRSWVLQTLVRMTDSETAQQALARQDLAPLVACLALAAEHPQQHPQQQQQHEAAECAAGILVKLSSGSPAGKRALMPHTGALIHVAQQSAQHNAAAACRTAVLALFAVTQVAQQGKDGCSVLLQHVDRLLAMAAGTARPPAAAAPPVTVQQAAQMALLLLLSRSHNEDLQASLAVPNQRQERRAQAVADVLLCVLQQQLQAGGWVGLSRAQLACATIDRLAALAPADRQSSELAPAMHSTQAELLASLAPLPKALASPQRLQQLFRLIEHYSAAPASHWSGGEEAGDGRPAGSSSSSGQGISLLLGSTLQQQVQQVARAALAAADGHSSTPAALAAGSAAVLQPSARLQPLHANAAGSQLHSVWLLLLDWLQYLACQLPSVEPDCSLLGPLATAVSCLVLLSAGSIQRLLLQGDAPGTAGCWVLQAPLGGRWHGPPTAGCTAHGPGRAAASSLALAALHQVFERLSAAAESSAAAAVASKVRDVMEAVEAAEAAALAPCGAAGVAEGVPVSSTAGRSS